MSKSVRVGIDVDGILANFFSAYEQLMVDIAGVDLFPARYPEIAPPVWDWPQHYGYSNDVVAEAWRRIKANPDFWVDLDPLSGAREFMREIDMIDPDELYFITDRPGIYPQIQTAAWLETALIVQQPHVIISHKGKGVVADALSLTHYLDDKLENVLDVMTKSPTTTTRLLNYPYNQSPLVGASHRINSLAEFAALIN